MKKSNQEVKLFALCALLIALLFAAPMGGKLFAKWRADKEKAAVQVQMLALQAQKRAEIEKTLSETKLEPMIETTLLDGPKWSTINFKYYGVHYQLSNFSTKDLMIRWTIEKGQQEFLNPNKFMLTQGWNNVAVRPGKSYILHLIGYVKAQRKETIVLRFDWTRGKKSGVKRFVITPQQKS